MDRIDVYLECAIAVLNRGQKDIGHMAAIRAASSIFELAETEYSLVMDAAQHGVQPTADAGQVGNVSEGNQNSGCGG